MSTHQTILIARAIDRDLQEHEPDQDSAETEKLLAWLRYRLARFGIDAAATTRR